MGARDVSEGTDAARQCGAQPAESLEASARAGAAVSAAFLAVPRHLFLPQVEVGEAYREGTARTGPPTLGRLTGSS